MLAPLSTQSARTATIAQACNGCPSEAWGSQHSLTGFRCAGSESLSETYYLCIEADDIHLALRLVRHSIQDRQGNNGESK